MPKFAVTASHQETHQRLLNRSRPSGFRMAVILALSIVVVAGGLLCAQPGRLNAGEQPPAGSQIQPRAATASSTFVTESRKALRNAHEDLTKLHAEILGLGDARRNYAEMRAASAGEIASQTFTVESAKAKLRYARLMREVAEIALREYRDGVLKQEKESAEAELKLAQDDLARAQPQIEQARERLAKIKQASGGSTSDLVNVWNHEFREYSAELEVKKAGFAIEQAQSKLRLNEEFNKVAGVKRLESDIEKQRSEELATLATRSLEESKLVKLQRSRDFDKTGVLLTDPQKRLMAHLVRAIPVEEKWSEKLARIENDGQSGDAVRQEITDLTSQVQAIIEKAQFELAAAALARLKGPIHRQAKLLAPVGVSSDSSRKGISSEPPTDSNTATRTVPKSSSFVTEHRKILAKLEKEFQVIGSRALAILEAPELARDYALSQQITAKSAEASFENAKLMREVAEIGIVEYEQGIFKQDEAKAMGELKLEESNVGRAGDMIEYSKGRLAQIKQASRGTAADLANEYAFEDKVIDSERRERIARAAAEKARSKLKILQDYTRPKRVKEMRAAVELARADELAKQAQMELEKAKLTKLEETIKNSDRPIGDVRILAILDQAIPIDERLQTKLAEAETDQGPGEALRKEVADLTSQFQGLIEQALAQEAPAKWARLKPDIHRAASQIADRPPK